MKNIESVQLDVAPDKEVHREVFDLARAVNNTLERTNILLDRLSPVMKKSKLTESGTKEIECETALASSVQSIRLHVENIVAFLDDILERLEV